MYHIVWLISKLYLLLFGSDTVFIFSKNAVFGNADPKSRDRGPKQLLKSKFLNQSINFKFQFQPLLWLSLIVKCFVASRMLFVDQFKVIVYHFRLIVYQFKVYVFSESATSAKRNFFNYFDQFIVFALSLKLFWSVYSFCIQFKVFVFHFRLIVYQFKVYVFSGSATTAKRNFRK